MNINLKNIYIYKYIIAGSEFSENKIIFSSGVPNPEKEGTKLVLSPK
jgi:hypothetical protein